MEERGEEMGEGGRRDEYLENREGGEGKEKKKKVYNIAFWNVASLKNKDKDFGKVW